MKNLHINPPTQEIFIRNPNQKQKQNLRVDNLRMRTDRVERNFQFFDTICIANDRKNVALHNEKQ